MDAVKKDVVALARAHASLVDDRERGEHVRRRVAGEVDAAREAYRRLDARRTKFDIMRDELKRAVDEASERRDEDEIEEIGARRRGGTP